MAKAPAPAAPDSTPKPNKGKKLIVILLVLLILLVLVAIGLFGVLLLKKNGGSHGAEDGEPQAAVALAPAAAPAPPTINVDLSKPPTFVALEPFVVNLARDEGDRYLQAVVVFRVGDAKTGEALKGFTPEIRHRINLVLSSKLPSEISTPEGREDLAVQIGQDINEILGFPTPRGARQPLGVGGPIQAVLFNSFIIQ